jgi:outer membrane protein assembly factor BamB
MNQTGNYGHMTDPRGEKGMKLLRNIALVSAIFAMILCVLVIINFIQVKRADPLNSPALKVLVERLQTNPGDDQLRQEIRELDLVARKAFFTSQWQVRVGGYLLFFSLLIVVICLKAIELQMKKIPDLPPGEKADFWKTRKINRTWMAYTGIAIVVVSLLLVFLTHRELGYSLDKVMASHENKADSGETGKAAAGTSGNENTGMTGNTDTAVQEKDSSGMQANMDGYPTWQEIKENYPGFRGAGSNGIAYQKNIPVSWDGKSGKNILWKTAVPLPGYNSPIIWGDRIFLSGANETRREVYCFDLNSGKLLWKSPVDKIPGSPSQAPKVNNETGQCASTMTTDGRRVYAVFANGDLIALDFDGNRIWSKSLGIPANHYGHSSSLVMYRDLLIIQYDQRGNASVMALAGKTGKEMWKTSRNVKVSWASPVLVNTGKRTELILAAEPVIASYNPSTGKKLWEMDCISGEVGPSPAYASGVVYSVNDYSKVAATEIGDPPKLLWEDNEYMSDIPSPLATGNYLILPTSYGTVVCYDARKGTKYWVHEFGNPIYASPMLAAGKIYILDKKGTMHIIKPDQAFTVIGEPALGEGSVCTPAFADGRIIIRGDKNLYCIGK